MKLAEMIRLQVPQVRSMRDCPPTSEMRSAVAGKPRVHELAKELGVESKTVLAKLQEMGEYVKSASSTVEAPVARRLREAMDASVQPPRRLRRRPPATAPSGRRQAGRRRRRRPAGQEGPVPAPPSPVPSRRAHTTSRWPRPKRAPPHSRPSRRPRSRGPGGQARAARPARPAAADAEPRPEPGPAAAPGAPRPAPGTPGGGPVRHGRARARRARAATTRSASRHRRLAAGPVAPARRCQPGRHAAGPTRRRCRRGRTRRRCRPSVRPTGRPGASR